MSHQRVESWMRDGRSEPMPREVRVHLEGCESCRASVAEAEETRGWFDDDAFVLPDTAASEMRFRLEAAAREPQARPSKRYGRTAWVVGAGLAAAAALALFLRAPTFELEQKDAPRMLALVTAEPGVVERESKSPHESYRLVDGTAHFEVTPLREGETFVVHVGTESVHVRGTSYRVEAEHGQLMAVRVSEGVVEVALDDVPNPMLHAGEAWVREAPEEPIEPVETIEAVVPVAPVAPVATPATPTAPSFDELYRQAWALHRDSRSAAAAAAFDRLLRHPDVGAREADVLFWSAQSHLARGNETRARERLERLVQTHPDSLRAGDARRQLGDL